MSDKKIWSKHLHRLRGPGRRRAQKKRGSQSVARLIDRLPKGSVIVDVGCGESGDRLLAKRQGLTAYGVDLFPPSHTTCEGFIQADAINLPFQSGSIDGVLCHAMTALIKPCDRSTLYEEIARTLKPNGLFSSTIYILADGWTVRDTVEKYRIVESGMHYVSNGLYRRCPDQNCSEHPDPGSWKAIQRAVNKVDINPQFRETASLLIALLVNGANAKKTSKFTEQPVAVVQSVIDSAVKCGILDLKTGWDLPWLDHYVEDEIVEGNINLVLDVLTIRGEFKRTLGDDGVLLYKLAKDVDA